MFCIRCGSQNRDDAKFCEKCGAIFGETRREEIPISIDVRAIKKQLFDKKTGFFAALFDFSFTDFVTSKIIKILYGLSIFLIGVATLVFVIFSFGASLVTGIFMFLIVGPLIFILGVIYTRILLEIIIVLFRIAEHTATMAGKSR